MSDHWVTINWLGFLAALLILVGIIAVTESADLKTRSEALAAMVKAGADPIDARCALRGTLPEQCVVIRALGKRP